MLTEVGTNLVGQPLAGEIELSLDARLVATRIQALPAPEFAQQHRVEAVEACPTRIGVIEKQLLIAEPRRDAAGPQYRREQMRLGKADPVPVPKHIGCGN